MPLCDIVYEKVSNSSFSQSTLLSHAIFRWWFKQNILDLAFIAAMY